jgi:nuclear pore complex protein Nup85
VITDALDSLLLAVIAGDSQGVISVCSRHLDPWFMAYSTALLSRAGGAQADVLRRPTASGASQSELYMLEYCSALATLKTTRDLAVTILASTHPGRGAEMISQALMRIAVEEDAEETEDDANAIAAYNRAVELNLPSTSARIARMASARAQQNGYTALAFDWLRRANDSVGTDALARSLARVDDSDPTLALKRVDGFLRKHGSDVLLKPSDDDETTNGGGGSTETCADFFRARQTFITAMSALRGAEEADIGVAKTAAEALIAALAPASTPDELWIPLIIDAIPLFESAFEVSALFTADAARLLGSRLALASTLSRCRSARDLEHMCSQNTNTHKVSIDSLRIATASLAVARLTTRLAFESQ